VARYAPAALVAALLVATALAFAYTESLKLTPSPILGTKVTKTFSPACDCDTDTAVIAFRLRQPDRLDVEIIDGGGTIVRHLIERQEYRRGPVQIVWNGRDDANANVPEGSYRPRVRLERQRRTIVLPNPIRVDVTPPGVAITRVQPRAFSPDGDRRADRVVVGYRTTEAARVSLFVEKVRRVQKLGQQTSGTIDWFGRVDGRALPQGVYELSLGAVDTAGNVGVRSPSRAVALRYVALGRTRIETRAGARFAVLVAADAATVGWRLGARKGVTKPGTLRLRAPLRPGRYTLTVTVGEHRARAAVIVAAP
jgi:hypothetical protein